MTTPSALPLSHKQADAGAQCERIALFLGARWLRLYMPDDHDVHYPSGMTILLLRLSNIRDTAASSTHRLLADLVCAALPDARVDFAFLPPKPAPRVTGVLSGKPWSEFDLILVSNSFVQEAVNLPWLLRANGVAAWAAERSEAFPPVLLGGSNAFASQCLVRPDGQAVPDAIFFGEAEESLPRFMRRWAAASGGKLSLIHI